MDLYVAGHIIEEYEEGPVWDILGVFDSEYKALTACWNENCFVGPIKLNESYPAEVSKWEGVYFPYEED